MNQNLFVKPGITDFGSFSEEYQFWIERNTSELLLTNVRKFLSSGGTVLDAGCGEGFLSVALASVAEHVVGIDLSPEMLALARRKAAAAGAGNVSFVLGDLGALAVRDEMFDVVVSSFALHHTDIELTLPLLAKAVKAGGWLVLQEPTCPVVGAGRKLWYRWRGLHDATRVWRKHGPSAAWRIGRFLQSRDYIGHQLNDQHWSEHRWREVVQQVLPGALCRYHKKFAHVVLLWQCPQTKEIRCADPEPVTASKSLRTSYRKTMVARNYPGRRPTDYEPFPREALSGSVVNRFESVVARHEGKPALRTNMLQMSYGELNAMANRVAARLLSCSGSNGVVVAVLMDQDDPSIPVLLGILKAGKAYTVLDPSDTPNRLQRVLSLAGAEILLTTGPRWQKFEVALGGLIDHCLLWEELGEGPVDNPGVHVAPEHLAALFFTSGSTGEPKGVGRDHLQFLHSTWLNTNTYFVAPSDRQSQLYFPGFTASVPNIFDTLLNGAALCSLNPRRVTPYMVLDWLIREDVTHFNPPIGLWRELTVLLQRGGYKIPNLRLLTLVGQVLYSKDIGDFQRLFGGRTTLLHLLAMTEAGAVTQGYIDGNTEIGEGPVPVGYSLPEKEVVILDENGETVPAGKAGLLAVTSAYLSVGYWRDKAKTEATFRPTLLDSRKRMFITSDRACLRPDGCLEYYGREDSIVKVRGYRVDMAAMEAVLNTHPQVREAAVVARVRSLGDYSVLAYLVEAEGDRPSTDDLRALLNRSLPHFMVPERFLWLEALPLTASGKIDRQVLSRKGMARPELPTPYAAPDGELERKLAGIWAKLLELEPVGRDDNFFELGGDSLMAMRMVHEVENLTGGQIPQDTLRHLTINRLVQALSRGRGEASTEPPRNEKDIFRTAGKRNNDRPIFKNVRRLIRNGPSWHGNPLLFSAGNVFHRLLVSQLWFHRLLFPRQIDGVSKWQAELAVDSCREALCRSLMANTWLLWRGQNLMNDKVFRKWVKITGAGRSGFEFSNSKNGSVFIVPHSGRMISALIKYCQRQRVEAVSITNDVLLVASDEEEVSLQQTIARTGQLWDAKRVLQKGGAVFIAGDGLMGNQSVEVPFWGRSRSFQVGAAWLAVTSSARFVPLFFRYDTSGFIEIKVCSTLNSQAVNEYERIVDLTEQYGRMYAENWPWFYSCMSWRQLDYAFNLPNVN